MLSPVPPRPPVRCRCCAVLLPGLGPCTVARCCKGAARRLLAEEFAATVARPAGMNAAALQALLVRAFIPSSTPQLMATWCATRWAANHLAHLCVNPSFVCSAADGYVVCYALGRKAFNELLGPIEDVWRYETLRKVW